MFWSIVNTQAGARAYQDVGKCDRPTSFDENFLS